MNIIVLTLAVVFGMPLMALSQGVPRSTVCPQVGKPAADVILTICTHESGMIVWPQPRLDLQVHRDGTGEYEMNPTYRTGDIEVTTATLVKATFALTPEELGEISRLLAAPELKEAKGEYPIYRHWDDSSMVTTLTVNDGAYKTIVINNFSEGDRENKTHYPKRLIRLMELVREIREREMGIVRPIPQISFCELLKNRDEYLGKKVAIYANFEYSVNILANLKIVNEREFLNDRDCDSPAMGTARTTESIGVEYSDKSGEIENLRNKTRQVRSARFGGRGRMLLTGMLMDDRPRAKDGFDYRFDISEVGQVERVILNYEGNLKLNWMYSDTFDHKTAKGLVLSSPLKMPIHHAGRIEWTNENKFPELRTSGRKHLVFRTVSEEVRMIGKGRWDSIFYCEIIEMK